MICHGKKAIFIHIPRNAGRSMEAYIGGKRPSNPHHTDIKILRAIEDGKYSDYFSFAIVRNPLDRMVSIFHHYIDGGNKSKADRKIQKALSTMGFYSFIRNLEALPDIIPGYHQELHPFIMEQHSYIFGHDDRMLLDYIARYEDIEQNAQYIGKRLGIQGSFPHKNRSDHEPYKNYYDPELVYIVRRRYHRDIELFYPGIGA